MPLFACLFAELFIGLMNVISNDHSRGTCGWFRHKEEDPSFLDGFHIFFSCCCLWMEWIHYDSSRPLVRLFVAFPGVWHQQEFFDRTLQVLGLPGRWWSQCWRGKSGTLSEDEGFRFWYSIPTFPPSIQTPSAFNFPLPLPRLRKTSHQINELKKQITHTNCQDSAIKNGIEITKLKSLKNCNWIWNKKDVGFCCYFVLCLLQRYNWFSSAVYRV